MRDDQKYTTKKPYKIANLVLKFVLSLVVHPPKIKLPNRNFYLPVDSFKRRRKINDLKRFLVHRTNFIIIHFLRY